MSFVGSMFLEIGVVGKKMIYYDRNYASEGKDVNKKNASKSAIFIFVGIF